MSVSIILELVVRPEHADDIKEKLLERLSRSRSFDGYLEIRAHEDPDQPGRFVMVEHWEDEAAYQRYQEANEADTNSADIGAALIQPPQAEVLQVIDS